MLNFRFSILHSFRENCIHTKINQDYLLHRQNQKFKGLLCTVEILQKTVRKLHSYKDKSRLFASSTKSETKELG